MTQEHPELPPAGWHADPAGSPQERYWDGTSWTGQLRPAEAHSEVSGEDATVTGLIPDSAAGTTAGTATGMYSPFQPTIGVPAAPTVPAAAPSGPNYQVPPATSFPGAHMGHAPQGSAGEAGFFRSLFDLSFAPERIVTIKFSRILYLIAMVFSILGWVLGVVILFAIGSMRPYDGAVFTVWGVLHLLFGWIIPLLTVVGFRVGLEVMIAIIRTSQHTAQLAHQGTQAEAFPRAQ